MHDMATEPDRPVLLVVGPVPTVRAAKSAPSNASVLVECVASDRLTKVPGLRKSVLERAGFRGAPGTTVSFDDGETVRVLVGVGPAGSVGPSQLRRAAAAAVAAAGRHRRVAVDYPTDLAAAAGVDLAAGVRAMAEGAVLGGYRYAGYKTSDPSPSVSAVTIVVDDADLRAARPAVADGVAVGETVCFARDLVNAPGGSLTPSVFADVAAERARAAGLDVQVLGPEEIAEERLGGLLAVNQGSVEEPRFLRLTWEPPVEDGSGEEVPTVVLVGKGITFDSGGLSLKPAEGMIGMKGDMGGAAAVIAAMCALPALGVPVRVIGLTPMTDNMTGGAAQRPGDVFTARNGTTVEVLNTDAEGRLILADALAWASDEEPDAIVDLATLTGACMVALGDRIAGLMSNDDDFRAEVADAAERAGERVWPLPLPADYRPRLDSPVADIKNIGGGRFGGTLTAGLFLQDFVGEGIPWAHIDIAGPSWLEEPEFENGKGATGFGVRTLVALLEGWGRDVVDEPDDDVRPVGT
jgi:leucyl aminopeptidase